MLGDFTPVVVCFQTEFLFMADYCFTVGLDCNFHTNSFAWEHLREAPCGPCEERSCRSVGPCPRGLQFVIPEVLRVFPSVLRSGEDGEFGHGGFC